MFDCELRLWYIYIYIHIYTHRYTTRPLERLIETRVSRRASTMCAYVSDDEKPVLRRRPLGDC